MDIPRALYVRCYDAKLDVGGGKGECGGPCLENCWFLSFPGESNAQSRYF